MPADALGTIEGRARRWEDGEPILLRQGAERRDEPVDLEGRDRLVFRARRRSRRGRLRLASATPLVVRQQVPADDVGPSEQVIGPVERDAAAPRPLSDVLAEIGRGVGVRTPAAKCALEAGLHANPGSRELGCNGWVPRSWNLASGRLAHVELGVFMRKLVAMLGIAFIAVVALGAPASAAKCVFIDNVPPGTDHEICLPL